MFSALKISPSFVPSLLLSSLCYPTHPLKHLPFLSLCVFARAYACVRVLSARDTRWWMINEAEGAICIGLSDQKGTENPLPTLGWKPYPTRDTQSSAQKVSKRAPVYCSDAGHTPFLSSSPPPLRHTTGEVDLMHIKQTLL